MKMKLSNLLNRTVLSVALAGAVIVALSTQAPAPAQDLPPLNDGGYNNGYQTYGQQGGYQQPNYGYNQNYNNPPYQNNQLQGRVSTAPAGTYMTATFTSPVSSEYARVGDRLMASLGTPITGSDGSILLPAGSQLEGQVVMVRPAGRAGRHGELDVRFTAALLPNGQRIPLSARIQTEDGTGLITGGSTKGRIGKAALKTGVGAGLGAALGTAMGPLSGGKVGKGAIYGTAIGGGLGALKAAWDKGDEAVIEAGRPLNIVLDQPLTVSPGMNAAPAYNNAPGYNNYGQSQPQYNNYGNPYNNNYGSGY